MFGVASFKQLPSFVVLTQDCSQRDQHYRPHLVPPRVGELGRRRHRVLRANVSCARVIARAMRAKKSEEDENPSLSKFGKKGGDFFFAPFFDFSFVFPISSLHSHARDDVVASFVMHARRGCDEVRASHAHLPCLPCLKHPNTSAFAKQPRPPPPPPKSTNVKTPLSSCRLLPSQGSENP
jgi:hypothetical protein